jgi:hypothetical protein
LEPKGSLTIVVGDLINCLNDLSDFTLECHSLELLVTFLKLGFFPVQLCYFGPINQIHQWVATINKYVETHEKAARKNI